MATVETSFLVNSMVCHAVSNFQHASSYTKIIWAVVIATFNGEVLANVLYMEMEREIPRRLSSNTNATTAIKIPSLINSLCGQKAVWILTTYITYKNLIILLFKFLWKLWARFNMELISSIHCLYGQILSHAALSLLIATYLVHAYP